MASAGGSFQTVTSGTYKGNTYFKKAGESRRGAFNRRLAGRR